MPYDRPSTTLGRSSRSCRAARTVTPRSRFLFTLDRREAVTPPPNGSRLSCGALTKDSFHNLDARRQLQALVRPLHSSRLTLNRPGQCTKLSPALDPRATLITGASARSTRKGTRIIQNIASGKETVPRV